MNKRSKPIVRFFVIHIFFNLLKYQQIRYLHLARFIPENHRLIPAWSKPISLLKIILQSARACPTNGSDCGSCLTQSNLIRYAACFHSYLWWSPPILGREHSFTESDCLVWISRPLGVLRQSNKWHLSCCNNQHRIASCPSGENYSQWQYSVVIFLISK